MVAVEVVARGFFTCCCFVGGGACLIGLVSVSSCGSGFVVVASAVGFFLFP